DLLLARALVEILRHALLEPGHALGEDRLALARQLLLGVHPVEQVGRIEIGDAATAAAGQRAREGDADGECDEAFRSAHGDQLFATGGSRACNASARERRAGGVSPSLAIMSSHCRVAVASLAFQADSASNSRALWRNAPSLPAAGSSRCSILGYVVFSSSSCAARMRARSRSAAATAESAATSSNILAAAALSRA